MTTEATSHTPDEGLRILARIIARDWAKRYLDALPATMHQDAHDEKHGVAVCSEARGAE
jgi:hypothetical protein